MRSFLPAWMAACLILSTCPGDSQTILREYWLGISGSSISALTSSPDYPDAPSGSDFDSIFEAPSNFAENFGTRMRGYVHPPIDGNYIFWIASDDQSELYLSSNEDPANKQRIARVLTWTGSRVWEEPRDGNAAVQKSSPVFLEAGRRYYVEALHKDGELGDNLAVGWQLPNGVLERPIPGNRLSPLLLSTNPPSIDQEPVDVTLPVGSDATFEVLASGASPLSFQWQRDSVNLAIETAALLTLRQVGLADSGARFRCVVSNQFGVAISRQALLSVHPETNPPVVLILNPPAGRTVGQLTEIEVTFDEPVSGIDAGDLMINEQAATNVTGVLRGPYVFRFASPVSGPVTVRWSSAHGITDQADPPNAFGGGSWSYQLNPGAPPATVIINEILAANRTGLKDEEGEEQDWIEIVNRGASAVDLAGWSLSDDPDEPGKWVFPSHTLAAGQYLVVFASGKDRTVLSGTNRFHANFKLGVSGEHLALYAPDGPRRLVSGFVGGFPEQRNDYSYGLDDNGERRYFAVPTPGSANGDSSIAGVVEPVHFSVERGHFTAPFVVALTTPTRNVQVRYTTDGSEPASITGMIYSDPLEITNTTMLRAAAFKQNFLPSKVGTHSYFFNMSVAQRSLPTLSIVTDTNNLVGPSGIIGIRGGTYSSDAWQAVSAGDYHNPSKHGIEWERPTSAEFIRPEDHSGFQIDCGIRVQGSDYQRPRTRPDSKFSFRLYFRGDYGPGRLRYPLFPLTTVEEFDQLVLRAGFNDPNNPFIRDELARRLSRDMGTVATHGNFVNLFVNGQYKGFYNPCERVHEEMMQAHLGGGDEWDVIGPSFAQSAEGPGIVDGDRTDFVSLVSYVGSRNVQDPNIYQEIERRLDLVNFVDYLLLNVYAAMGDWSHNNFRAGKDRAPNSIWRFIVWDGEWGFGIYGRSVTRDTFAESGPGPDDSGLASTGNSEIARLYQALRQSAEFRLLWADRIHKHMFNGGAIADANIVKRFDEMRTELSGVIPGMELTIRNSWVPQRRNIIMGHFNNYGLLASSNAPTFSQFGGRVPAEFDLSMSTTAGTIYYTLDGTDPRERFADAVAASAMAYVPGTPVELSQTVLVKARALHNGKWSALTEALFEVASLGVPLRITEIMYNPPGGPDYEFIELQNAGGAAIDLSGFTFEGVSFLFPEGTSIAPGEVIVLAANAAAFASQYPGVPIAGVFSGNLSNGGERIAVLDRNGQVITSLDYDDESGWPATADGGGYSLEIVSPMADPDAPSNWRQSGQTGGSPGQLSPPPPAGDVRINEVMADNLTAVNHEGTFPDWVELHNASGASLDLSGWSLSDDGEPRKFVFPPGAMLAAGGYLVVWCDASTNTTSGFHTGFALGRGGESVFLYDDQTNRVDAVTFGLQLADYSVGRVNGNWSLTLPTPGTANMEAPATSAANLIINEWMANPLPGEDDWLELHNRSTNAPVALQGIHLASGGGIFQMTALSFLGPGGFIQIHADEQPGPDHVDFKLPAAGGTAVLYDAAGVEINRVTYGVQAEGVSQGRFPDGNAAITTFPGSASPGAPNYRAIWTGPVIHEILARNRSIITNSQGRVADWVEFYNPNASPFDMTGLSLSVDSVEPGQWNFPGGLAIPANGYLVVWCDGGSAASTNDGYLNTGRSLDGESGGVYLFNAAGQMVDSTEYGFQISDRPIGRVGGQWRLLAAPTPGSANGTAAVLGSTTALRINEWMASPASGDDWFELYNPGSMPVDLSGLYLTDDPSLAGRAQFAVPPLSFIDAGRWVKWVADGDSSRGRDHVNFQLDNAGELIRLYQSNFALIDTVSFAAQQLGISEGRLPDGATTIVQFAGSATPGDANYQLLPGVSINEVLSHAQAPTEDAIELHNGGAAAAQVGGWFLSDSTADFKKYRIADGTSIPADGYLVIGESLFNSSSPGSFALSAVQGGELWLSEADSGGNLSGRRSRFPFGATAADTSFGPHLTSLGMDYVSLSARTPGQPNAAVKIGPVILNEIMYNPPEQGGSDNIRDEFVELHNDSEATVLLYDPVRPANTWRLRGGVEFEFPSNASIPAGSYMLVVSFDPVNDPASLAQFRAAYALSESVPLVGPYRGRLSNSGEGVELRMPGTPPDSPDPEAGLAPYALVDKADYKDAPPWPFGPVDGGGFSLQRKGGSLYGNEPLNWTGASPTPGAANGAPPVAIPMVAASPQDQSALEDATVVLEVAANGGQPLHYQWRRNGLHLPNATNSMLVLDYVSLELAGSYDVFVSNPAGSALSEPADLVIHAPPVIVREPQSRTVRGGTNVTLSVGVRGSPPLSFQWYLDGIPILGATSETLNLTNVGLDDHGEYTVVVTNPFASASARADLIVLVDPAFVLHPVHQRVIQGGTAIFSVQTTGTLPMGYRWRIGGSPLTNLVLNSHVSFVVLTNVQMDNQGTYSVIITNAAFYLPGYLSSGGTLTVIPDFDGDGLPDEWENLYGLNPNSAADASSDTDNDGFSASEEYEAGTNPNDGASHLRIDAIALDQEAVLRFFAGSNHAYSVLYSDGGFGNGAWLTLMDVAAARTNRVVEIRDRRSFLPRRFYRLVAP